MTEGRKMYNQAGSAPDNQAPTLSTVDVEIIKAFISEAVNNAFEDWDHPCKLDMAPEQLDKLKSNYHWVNRLRGVSDKIGTVVLSVIVVTLTGGFLSALWMGLKSLADGGK